MKRVFEDDNAFTLFVTPAIPGHLSDYVFSLTWEDPSGVPWHGQIWKRKDDRSLVPIIGVGRDAEESDNLYTIITCRADRDAFFSDAFRAFNGGEDYIDRSVIFLEMRDAGIVSPDISVKKKEVQL
jgi:hypothetical protein